MASLNLINIGPGNSLVHDRTKSIPEVMLTYTELGPVASSEHYLTENAHDKNYHNMLHI